MVSGTCYATGKANLEIESRLRSLHTSVTLSPWHFLDIVAERGLIVVGMTYWTRTEPDFEKTKKQWYSKGCMHRSNEKALDKSNCL